MPTEYRASKPGPHQGPTPVSYKVVKTLAFCGAKKEDHPMTKIFSSITLLLLAPGWLSILPAQTQTKYVCIHCNKEFSSKSEESQKCNANIEFEPANPIPIKGPHEFRPK